MVTTKQKTIVDSQRMKKREVEKTTKRSPMHHENQKGIKGL